MVSWARASLTSKRHHRRRRHRVVVASRSRRRHIVVVASRRVVIALLSSRRRRRRVVVVVALSSLNRSGLLGQNIMQPSLTVANFTVNPKNQWRDLVKLPDFHD